LKDAASRKGGSADRRGAARFSTWGTVEEWGRGPGRGI
jgi:hypothetical protein